MQETSTGKDFSTPQFAQNIPKLAAPDSGNGAPQNNENQYDYTNTQSNGYDNAYYDNNQYDYNNYNQGYDQQQPVGSDE